MQHDDLEQPLAGIGGDCVSWHMVDDHTILIKGCGETDDYIPHNLPPWYMHKITAGEIGEGITGIGIRAFSAFYTKARVSHLSTPASFTYTIDSLIMWDDKLTIFEQGALKNVSNCL